MLKIRNVISTVNKEYIYSAAQADAYRTESPFKLQGSYRDMNKMVEKVIPVMNQEELQTPTSDAEANLLKFKHITNISSKEEAKYWQLT